MTSQPSAPPGPPTGGADALERPRRRYSVLTRRDKIVMGLMVGIPTFLCLALIWFPTIFSVGLSFTNWQGYTGLEAKNFIGLKNYERLFTAYQPFWLAVVGIIWQLQYTSQGFINSVLGRTGQGNVIDWLGNPDLNIWALLVAASWRHVGYVMVLYLAGLKSVDPTLREAAAIDGANARQTFFRVIFPVMRPINVVIVVVTVIESLRAFDIVYIINQGKNGLELLSVLITNLSIGEAQLLGFGSAVAVVLLVISLVPIVIFLTRTTRPGAE